MSRWLPIVAAGCLLALVALGAVLMLALSYALGVG